MISGFEQFVTLRYDGVAIRMASAPLSDETIIWLKARRPDGSLAVRSVHFANDTAYSLDALELQFSYLDEAYISLCCELLSPRDGGKLTQDDAIRGWL